MKERVEKILELSKRQRGFERDAALIAKQDDIYFLIKDLWEENQRLEQGWQSIETAPKMGKILLWHKNVYKIPHIGWFNVPSNQWELIEFFKDKRDNYVPPTHWQPLPQPPEGGV